MGPGLCLLFLGSSIGGVDARSVAPEEQDLSEQGAIEDDARGDTVEDCQARSHQYTQVMNKSKKDTRRTDRIGDLSEDSRQTS